MTTKFLDSYIFNLELLVMKLSRNHQFIQLWDMNVQKLASLLHQKLNQFVDEIIEEKLDVNEPESKIEVIHSLLKQKEKCDAERRLLARASTEILDEYLTLLDENFINCTIDTLKETTKIEELFPKFRDLALKKPQTDQPTNVKVSEWLKNLHGDDTTEDVNKNVTMSNVTCLKSNLNEVTCDNMEGAKMESGSSVSDGPSETDNFQIFKRKVLDFCSKMRNRNEKEMTNSADPSEDVVSVSSEENDYERIICHCQQQAVGKMIACDNKKCKIRWYHFECVGIFEMPDGDWFCPYCTIFSM